MKRITKKSAKTEREIAEIWRSQKDRILNSLKNKLSIPWTSILCELAEELDSISVKEVTENFDLNGLSKYYSLELTAPMRGTLYNISTKRTHVGKARLVWDEDDNVYYINKGNDPIDKKNDEKDEIKREQLESKLNKHVTLTGVPLDTSNRQYGSKKIERFTEKPAKTEKEIAEIWRSQKDRIRQSLKNKLSIPWTSILCELAEELSSITSKELIGNLDLKKLDKDYDSEFIASMRWALYTISTKCSNVDKARLIWDKNNNVYYINKKNNLIREMHTEEDESKREWLESKSNKHASLTGESLDISGRQLGARSSLMSKIKDTETKKNLLKAFADELQARESYTHYASVAQKEGYLQIKALFLETAENKREHANRFFKFLEDEDAEITASYTASKTGTTLEILKAAAAGGNKEWSELYPAFDETAKKKVFDELAKTFFDELTEAFSVIAKLEKKHETRYSKLEQVCAGGIGLMTLESLYDYIGKKIPLEMNIMESEKLAILVEGIGFGIAPDIRYHSLKPSLGSKVVVFPNGHGADFSPSKEYWTLATILRLGAMVSQIDDDIAPAEQTLLQSSVNENQNLTQVEKDSLLAFLQWCLHTPQGMLGIKERLDEISQAEKFAIGHKLISVAHADGVIDPREVKQLEKLYLALGLNKEQVISDLHTLAAASILKPNVVVTKPKFFSLDEDLIRIITEETRQVKGLLEGVFADQEEEEEVEHDSNAAVLLESPLDVLDIAHQDLFYCLLQQEIWERRTLQELCKELGLMLDGAMEVLNEWSFEIANAPIIEDGERIFVDVNLAKEIIDG